MRKLTKGFLIAAVVLILFGLALCAGGAAAGGIALANDEVRSVLKGRDYHVTINKKGIQIENENDDRLYNYDGVNEMTFLSEEIKSIEIEISKAQVEILENDSSEEFSVYTDGGKFDVGVKHGVLYIRSDSKLNENKVCVEIPAGFEFDEVDISAGAADVDVQRISARNLDVEIGAGAAEIGEVLADEAEFEIGAGQIVVLAGNVRDCSVSVDLGDFQYDGTITVEGDIECGMGNADIRLEGKEEDYNYEIECSAGSVNIGDRSYSGVGFEQFVNNHAAATMEIECSMGNVTIGFNEGSYENNDSLSYNGQHHEEQHHNEF